jgi:hypothetical protein
VPLSLWFGLQLTPTNFFALQLGLNGLADLTHEEYKHKYALGFRKFQKTSNKLTSFSHGSLDADNLPQEVDWRKQKAVAEVKNQQQV